MMSLVNNSLKLQMTILQIHCYFLLKKCEENSHIFSTKSSSVFAFEVDIWLTNRGLNGSVKLTKF